MREGEWVSMTQSKDAPLFVMRLSGPKAEMERLKEKLIAQFAGTEAKLVVKGSRATLVAKVPQAHARAAMAFAGLP